MNGNIMTDGNDFSVNGFKVKVPPAGKPAAGSPALGTVWPSDMGGLSSSALLVYEYDIAKTPPEALANSYSTEQDPDSTFLAPLFRNTAQFKEGPSEINTIAIYRELVMHYVWRAIVVELNTGGGYSEDKKIETGVQTGSTEAKTFSAHLGAEESGAVPFFGFNLKLNEAYNWGNTSTVTTNLTKSESTTVHVTADKNQRFIHWQFYERHVLGKPKIAANVRDVSQAEPYFKAFDAAGMADQYPDLVLESATLLPSGEGVFSSTSYPVA
jgi:hypothetical protein